MEQVRMPISELETFLAEKLSFNITRTHLLLTMSNGLTPISGKYIKTFVEFILK